MWVAHYKKGFFPPLFFLYPFKVCAISIFFRV